MKEMIHSTLRHGLTYLAGLLAYAQAQNYLTSADAAAATAASEQVVEPLAALLGLAAAVALRLVISKFFPGADARGKAGDWMHGIILPLVAVCALSSVGLGSCAPPVAFRVTASDGDDGWVEYSSKGGLSVVLPK